MLNSSPIPASVDGLLTTGRELSCSDLGWSPSECETLVDDAVSTMRGLTSTTLTGYTLHAPMETIDGRVTLMTISSSTVALLVARFGDGSVHAALLGCQGVSAHNAFPPCEWGSPVGGRR